MSSKYASWTIVLLKEELRNRKVRVSGKKKDLIARLEGLDAMAIKGTGQEPDAEYHMDLPDPALFTDIHSDSSIPDVPKQRIEDYLKNQDKEIDEKIKDMYEERYVRFVRFAPHKDNKVYISGGVWAEMRKSVSYKVDIAMDNHAVVQEAQCECAAGQGPAAHCKHVVCILYSVHRCSIDKTIITEQTCTQVLQTFHRAKPYHGSPMKASDLEDIRTQTFTCDPRKDKYRKRLQYADEFRNKVLNYKADHRMPALQLYQPANPYALNTMHDYCGSSTKLFLQQNKLCTITSEEIADIEAKTRGQAGNKHWALERGKRITSSNFGTVCKATSRRDISKLAAELVTPKAFSNAATKHGRAYEAVAVEEFERHYMPSKVCGLFVSQDNPWLAASPDRLVDEDTIVEVKCPYTARNKPINPTTVPYLQTDDNGLHLNQNHAYYYQVQGQLLCADKTTCYFCIYTLKDFKVMQIQRDEGFIQEMIEKLNAFYEDYFVPAFLKKHLYRYYDHYF